MTQTSGARHACVRWATMHHGQVCFSTERIVVQRAVHEEFARLLAAEMRTIAAATTSAQSIAVTNARAAKAKGSIDEAVRGGAKFLVGSADMSRPAALAPSILTDVSRDCALTKGEAFAPMACLQVVDTEEEAIAEANSRIGGLSVSVFTGSYERGLRVARAFEFGMVQVNNMTLFAERESSSLFTLNFAYRCEI